MEKSLKDALRQLAEKNRRLLSDYVRLTLEDAVARERMEQREDASDQKAVVRALAKQRRAARG